MPGHKGRALPGNTALAPAYAWDITEINGADSLFEADGILLAAEQRTAAVWGSSACCWSAGGSTLCIQAMLARMRMEDRTVIAARTVHRAFLNSCALLDLPVRWVWPSDGSILSGTYRPEDFDAALSAAVSCGEHPCVYITSPDYPGRVQDIAGIAKVCHAHGAPLLVDNAHGVHLAFLGMHPITLGADYCCDSVHKMLPGLTGAALLHCRDAADAPEMKRYMQLFGSTSPSYLIMQSIEACTAWLEGGGADAVRSCAERAWKLRRALPEYRFTESEPLHLSVSCDGNDLARQLRQAHVECEYADSTRLVMLLSPVMTEAEFAALEQAMRRCKPLPPAQSPVLPSPAEQVCSIREAALSRWELVPLSRAEGRVCGPVQVPCPPAVPIVVSGERLTAAWLKLMAFYGLREAAVMVL